MLETIDARLAQATAGELGHIEFLQALCEDEVDPTRRGRARCAGCETAHFESTTTIEEFDFSFNPKIPAAQIRDLATLRFIEAGRVGHPARPRRRGEVHDRPGPRPCACRRGYSVAFTKTSRLVGRPGRRPRRSQLGDATQAWTRPDVLILDDFAMREFTLAQADDLYEVVTERGPRRA